VTELASIALVILAFLALLYICSRLWIGFLMCRLFGYEKAMDVIAAFYLALDEHTDERMRAGMKELHTKGEL
jgi:predicted Na+-dependent transporter